MQFYPLVIWGTLGNVQTLARRYLAEPVPTIRALLGADVAAPTNVLTALGRLAISSVSWSIPGALGAIHAITDVASAAVALNPVDMVNAPPNAPVRIVDSLVNGYTIPLVQMECGGSRRLTHCAESGDQGCPPSPNYRKPGRRC